VKTHHSADVRQDAGNIRLSSLDDRPELRAAVRRSRMAKATVVAADGLAIATAMVLAAGLYKEFGTTTEPSESLLLTAAISLPVWLGVFARHKLYLTAAVWSFPAEFSRIVHAIVTATACTALVEVLIAAPVSRAWLLLLFALGLAIVVVERLVVRWRFQRARSRGRLERRVVVIGTNSEALALDNMLKSDSALGYKVVGFLDCGGPSDAIASTRVLGSCDRAVELLRDFDASGVVIATSAVDVPVANRLARELMELGYHVELTSGLVDIATNRLLTRPLGRRPVVYVEPVHRVGWRSVAKRAFDVVISAGTLVITAPLLLVAAVGIKIDSRGPVFFRQERVGKNGEQFAVLKLRTMVVGAELMLSQLQDRNHADGPLFKLRDDPRVTRVGRVLRKWSIDELPQFWNVLRGEMSIVGPRPALPNEVLGWPEDLRNRLRVKPGITGMWQVNGRSSSSFGDYERYDLYYVDNWSLLGDLAIFLKTIPVVLLRRGAF
jgi:exopolysaccharide biosynthesis polyprenyl glycosylphosphotransferase